MNEVEKKGIGKSQVGLVVAVVFIAILAVSSVWLYMRMDSLQTEVDSLTSEKNTLQNQVYSLTANNTDLRSEVDSLETENFDLQLEVYSLKKSQIHLVGDFWTDLYPEPYVNCYGYLFNSGNLSAHDVVLTIRVYDFYDALLTSEEVNVGDIDGKSYQTFDVDVECIGYPDTIYYEWIWSYY